MYLFSSYFCYLLVNTCMALDIFETGVWEHPELPVGSNSGGPLENVLKVQVSATENKRFFYQAIYLLFNW